MLNGVASIVLICGPHCSTGSSSHGRDPLLRPPHAATLGRRCLILHTVTAATDGSSQHPSKGYETQGPLRRLYQTKSRLNSTMTRFSFPPKMCMEWWDVSNNLSHGLLLWYFLPLSSVTNLRGSAYMVGLVFMWDMMCSLLSLFLLFRQKSNSWTSIQKTDKSLIYN